jgi:hypothetical protein
MTMQMIGIGFFGYMVGTLQKMIIGLQYLDPLSEQQDRVRLWLVKLDKIISLPLPKNVYGETIEFYNQQFKWDTTIAYENPFFDQLKPRLQNLILDCIFKNYYTVFDFLFENTEMNFKRTLFKNVKFEHYGSQKFQQKKKSLQELV